MSGKIEPALTEEEWAHFRDRFQMYEEMGTPDIYKFEGYVGAQGVAVHNSIIDDGDPRKITREKIETMRMAWDCLRDSLPRSADDTSVKLLESFADALAAYLPPEKSE